MSIKYREIHKIFSEIVLTGSKETFRSYYLTAHAKRGRKSKLTLWSLANGREIATIDYEIRKKGKRK